MKINSFEEILAWKKGKELAVFVYKLTRKEPFSKDYGLKDQIQRCAVSIPSNIAEGFERQSNKEFKQFLYIAKGSSAELRTQLSIAHELGYISQEEFKAAHSLCEEIAKMLSSFIQHLHTS